MRTLIGAADPPPRRPVDGYTFTTSGSSTARMADAVITYALAVGVTVSPWQAVVIHQAYGERAPYRTTAYAGDPLPPGTPAIEGEIV